MPVRRPSCTTTWPHTRCCTLSEQGSDRPREVTTAAGAVDVALTELNTSSSSPSKPSSTAEWVGRTRSGRLGRSDCVLSPGRLIWAWSAALADLAGGFLMATRDVQTAIVLQGGGALGAYEYGVLQALYEQRRGFQP